MGDYRDNYRYNFFIALTGFSPILEFFILRPDPLIPQFTPVLLLLGGFIVLLLSTGLAEELLFLVILQNNAMKFIGTGWGLLYTPFSILHHAHWLDILC